MAKGGMGNIMKQAQMDASKSPKSPGRTCKY